MRGFDAAHGAGRHVEATVVRFDAHRVGLQGQSAVQLVRTFLTTVPLCHSCHRALSTRTVSPGLQMDAATCKDTLLDLFASKRLPTQKEALQLGTLFNRKPRRLNTALKLAVNACDEGSCDKLVSDDYWASLFEWDHELAGATKSKTISVLVDEYVNAYGGPTGRARWSAFLEEYFIEVHKCRLLCLSCHRRSTAEEFGRRDAEKLFSRGMLGLVAESFEQRFSAVDRPDYRPRNHVAAAIAADFVTNARSKEHLLTHVVVSRSRHLQPLVLADERASLAIVVVLRYFQVVHTSGEGSDDHVKETLRKVYNVTVRHDVFDEAAAWARRLVASKPREAYCARQARGEGVRLLLPYCVNVDEMRKLSGWDEFVNDVLFVPFKHTAARAALPPVITAEELSYDEIRPSRAGTVHDPRVLVKYLKQWNDVVEWAHKTVNQPTDADDNPIEVADHAAVRKAAEPVLAELHAIRHEVAVLSKRLCRMREDSSRTKDCGELDELLAAAQARRKQPPPWKKKKEAAVTIAGVATKKKRKKPVFARRMWNAQRRFRSTQHRGRKLVDELADKIVPLEGTIKDPALSSKTVPGADDEA